LPGHPTTPLAVAAPGENQFRKFIEKIATLRADLSYSLHGRDSSPSARRLPQLSPGPRASAAR
jgi:hypothetical protein